MRESERTSEGRHDVGCVPDAMDAAATFGPHSQSVSLTLDFDPCTPVKDILSSV